MTWTQTELELIGQADELEFASLSDDGALSPFVTMWVVRVGEEIYVRSAGGASRPWFQRATSSGTGHIRAGGIEAEVAFDKAPVGADIEIDASYHEKYDRYGSTIVGHVTGPGAHQVTIRLVRRTKSYSHDVGR